MKRLCALVLGLSVAVAGHAAETVDSPALGTAWGVALTSFMVVYSAGQQCDAASSAAGAALRPATSDWLTRNRDYLRAARAYSRRYFTEVEAKSGAQARANLEKMMIDTTIASETASALLSGHADEGSCRKMAKSLEDGELDFARNVENSGPLAELLSTATPWIDSRDPDLFPLALKGNSAEWLPGARELDSFGRPLPDKEGKQ